MSYNQYVPDGNENITLKQLLSRVDEQQIMKWYFGDKFAENVKSPVRSDDDYPGCYFEYHNGRYVMVDWANPFKKNWTVFDLIMDATEMTFKEALQFVDANILKASYNSVRPAYHKPTFNFIIHPVYRQFNYLDKQFWSKRTITRGNLIEDNVYPVNSLWVNSRLNPGALKPVDLYSISYYIPTCNGRGKVYRPHETKKDKWMYSNVKKDDILFLHLLPSKVVILTKSYKDARILINLGYTALSTQGEKSIPSYWVLDYICRNCDMLFVLYDTDVVGKIKGYELTKIIQEFKPSAEQLIYPEEYNDTDDFYLKDPKGLELFLHHEVRNSIQFSR